MAGTCPPVDRMYVTATPVITTLAMAENYTKQTALGCIIVTSRPGH